MDISELKALMESLGWSARRLAQETGLHYNTIHYMFNGRNFTAKTYNKCMETLLKAMMEQE